MANHEIKKHLKLVPNRISQQPKLDNNPWDLGRGLKMVLVNGVWRMVDRNKDLPPPQRLDELIAQRRDLKWRQSNE